MLYETKEDRTAEKNLQWLLEYAGRSAFITPTTAPADFVVGKNGQLTAFAELKVRTTNMDAYPNYTVDRRKVDKLIEHAKLFGVSAVLFVQWADVTKYVELSPPYPLIKQGRKDRNDPNDIDIQYEIPLSSFRNIE